MSKKIPGAKKPAQTSAEYLQSVVDRQMDMLKAYKIRQDDIVRALGGIQKLIGLGSFEAAATMMTELMARDLKQAKDRQDNHAFALDIAIKHLEKTAKGELGSIGRESTNVLSQIELLVPEAFEKPLVPAGSRS